MILNSELSTDFVDNFKPKVHPIYSSCSLVCWKSHKETDCEKPIQAETNVNAEPAPAYFPTEDTVDPVKLQLLSESEIAS